MEVLSRGGANSWPASVAAALLVASVIAGALRWAKKRRSTSGTARARLPGGSLGWLLVGETLAFISAAYSPRPESFVEKRRLLYGKVFKSHLWGSPAVVSSDAEVSRAVLQADASSFVPWYPRSLMELMGESSILVLGGGLQRRVHGLSGAFFKSPQLKARVTAGMQRRVAEAMDAWRRRCGGDGGAGAVVVRVQDEAKSSCRSTASFARRDDVKCRQCVRTCVEGWGFGGVIERGPCWAIDRSLAVRVVWM